MKKNISLMLLAFVFLLFGCQQELDLITQDNQTNVYTLNKENIRTQILKKSDYESKNFLKSDIERASNFLRTQQGENIAFSKSIQKIDGYEIYTDTFEEVSYLTAKYYSFYIIGQDNTEYEEKLVLKSIDDQVTEKYILRYKRKLDFSIDPKSYQTIKLSNSSNANGRTMFIDTFSMGCSTYTVTSYECGYTGHHTNGQYCNVLNATMPYNIVSVSFDPNCMAGEGGGSSSSGGGGGGGVPGTYIPPVITIPTSAPIYTTHGPKGKTCNPLGLNPTEIGQINDDQSLRLKIYQYIAISGSTGYPLPCDNEYFVEEYKGFIKSIIKYVSESGTSAHDLSFDYLNTLYIYFQNEYYNMAEPESFVLWALQFKKDNPNVTLVQFQNWFMTKSEGQDGEHISNLDNILNSAQYQTKQMPTYSQFVSAFPKVDYSGYPGYYLKMPASQVYPIIGGYLESLYNDKKDNGPFRNACAARWSLGMNGAGILIPQNNISISGANINGQPRYYIVNSTAAGDFMQKTFGNPTHKLLGADANNSTKIANFLNGKTGIYVVVNNSYDEAGYYGHIDLIQNGHIPGGANVQNVPGGIKSIRIWEFTP